MTLARSISDREDAGSEEDEIVAKRPRNHRDADDGSGMDSSSRVGDDDAGADMDIDLLGSQLSSRASISPVAAEVPDPPPAPRWLSVKDVVEMMGTGLSERVVRRLHRDEQVVVMGGKEVRIAMLLRCKHATHLSWEGVAEALDLDWSTFLDQFYLVATLYEYINKDGKKVNASAMLCYFFGDAGVEAGRAALCDLLRVSTRRDKLASLAEYVPPCYPVAAYFDLDQYHYTGLEDTGKLEKVLLNDFARAWRKVRNLLITDKERRKAPLAIARSSRVLDLGAAFKCSMHIHDPHVVFDSPKTLIQFVRWFVREHGGAIKCNKMGGPPDASAIDTSVYNGHALFRLPLTVKFGGDQSTLLRVADRDRLDDYIISRPRAGDVITLQMLRDNIPKFAKDPRSSMADIIPAAPRDSYGMVDDDLADYLNTHFRLPRAGWRREPWAADPGAVVLKYGGHRCVGSGEMHSQPWHSGVIYHPYSGEVTLTCANRAHSNIPLDHFVVPVVALPDTSDRDGEDTGRLLREGLASAYGMCPDNEVDPMRMGVLSALLGEPPDKVKWYAVNIRMGIHTRLMCEDGRVVDIRISELFGDGVIGADTLNVFFRGADGVPVDVDSERARILAATFIWGLKFYGTPLARITNHSDRINLYVHQVFRLNGFCMDNGVIYTKRVANRVLLEAYGGVDLDDGEDMLQRFIETICMSPSAPENVRAGWIALPKNQNIQAVEKVRSLKNTYPKAKWRNCVAFANGILDLPMDPRVDLDTLRAGFTPWADLPDDVEPFIPRLEVPECAYDPDFFDNPEHTPGITRILQHQIDPDDPMYDTFVAYCGRMYLHKAWFVNGILSNDAWGHFVVTGESSTGKSTLLRAVVSPFQPAKVHLLSQARAGRLGMYKLFTARDCIYMDECSSDPADELYKKFTLNFFKQTARHIEIEIDDIYNTNNRKAVISAPMIFAANGHQFGFETQAKSEADHIAMNRSAVWFRFDNQVDEVDTSLGTTTMEERGAFLCRSIWVYLSRLKEWGPDLRTQSFFRCHLEDRLTRYHPYARYLAWCLAHQDGRGLAFVGNQEYHVLRRRTDGGGLFWVSRQDLAASFDRWRGPNKDPGYKPEECAGIFRHFGFNIVTNQNWSCARCSNPVHGITLLGTGNCRHGRDNRGTVHVRPGYIINADIATYGGNK